MVIWLAGAVSLAQSDPSATCGTTCKLQVATATVPAISKVYRQKGYRYLSPLPGAIYVMPGMRFVLLRLESADPAAITNLDRCITVAGEVSPVHAIRTWIAADARTVIHEFEASFVRGEQVTVSLDPQGLSGLVEPYEYEVFVADHADEPPQVPSGDLQPPPSPPSGEPRILPNGVAVPSDFPGFEVSVNRNPAPGYIWLESQTAPAYTMILDNNGDPVWYRRGGATDFKLQPNGMITCLFGDGFIAYDQNFTPVDTYHAVNHYVTDDHELQLLPNGGYLLLGIRSMRIDMRYHVAGGSPAANVRETVIQEFTAAHELIFQWRAWDHFDVKDLQPHVADPRSNNFRFSHMNAVDVDVDGNFILSSRHLSEITKIDRDTGDIIWRLGGANNQFAFVNDPLGGFHNQHHIRAIGDNRYTLFDNGNLHAPPVSRAVEYELNTETMQAILLWEYRDDMFAYHKGSAQRLPNGNTLINFVMEEYPKALEIDPSGQKQFELNYVAGDSAQAYRVFRFPWTGVVPKPLLLVETPADNITLIHNRFGDPDVAVYRIYSRLSDSGEPYTLHATSEQALTRLTHSLQPGRTYDFRVTAVDRRGRESEPSNEVTGVLVNFIGPGQNAVRNGDFEQGALPWTLRLNGTAAATWAVTDGRAQIDIVTGGLPLSDVQLVQTGVPLTQGDEYVLEFDAWCTPQPRRIAVKLGQGEADYSMLKPPQITPVRTRYRFTFTMTASSDYAAQLTFNLGTYPNSRVFLDDISLVKVPTCEDVMAAGLRLPADFDRNCRVDILDLARLAADWLRCVDPSDPTCENPRKGP